MAAEPAEAAASGVVQERGEAVAASLGWGVEFRRTRARPLLLLRVTRCRFAAIPPEVREARMDMRGGCVCVAVRYAATSNRPRALAWAASSGNPQHFAKMPI